MPAPETDLMYQVAVFWPFVGYDPYGVPTQGPPVEIAVRWNDDQSEALDPQGNTISIDATVQCSARVDVGSDMWLGRLADWYSLGSAGEGDNVMEVKTSNGSPDLKNRYIKFSVGLIRKGGVPSRVK